MELLPAIDLRHGEVVRLRRGDDAERTRYAADPRATLDAFAGAGVRRAHVVDLDAAFGEPAQRCLLAELAAASVVGLQLGGGLRSREGVDWALSAGFARVVLGSLVARDPQSVARLAAELPGKIVAAIELRGGSLQVSGWRAGAVRGVDDVLAALRGSAIAAALVTDVERDGMLDGPNLELAARVGRTIERPVLVSGGVRSLDDLRAARERGFAGVVVGRALYESAFTLEEALRAAAGEAVA